MTNKDAFKGFLDEIQSGIPGVYAVSIVDIESGVTIAARSTGNLDPEVASAYNVEVVKSKFAAIKALGLKEKINDILISLSTQVHVLKITPNEKYMLYLAADASKVNMGMARSVMKLQATKIEKVLR